MKPRDERRPVQQRNTLFGFIEVTLWNGQRALVKVSDITYICEHTARDKQQGSRIGIAPEPMYLQDDFDVLMSRVTAEQFRELTAKGAQ